MNLDKYQQAWQEDAAQTRVTIDADLLAKEVERSQRAFRAAIFWRDVLEVGVALLLIPIWVYMGTRLALPWTWYLTVPALIWVMGFILVDRKRNPQRSSEPGKPLLYFLKESLTQVEHQIWLLRNVFWWYLLPFSISIMAFFAHTFWIASSVWWEFCVVVGFLGLFLFLLYGSIYLLNQRAVREQLEPRRQDMLKLVASLEDETTSEDSREIFNRVSALADSVQGNSWAENWYRMIPSWRTATAIALVTLGGMFCGLLSPFEVLGPIFFQAVVGAVIAFEVALAYVWLWSGKNREPTQSGNGGSKTLATRVGVEQSPNQERPLLPGAPAILIIGLTVFLSIMAVLALCRFISDQRFMDEPLQVPGLENVSAFGADDMSDIDAWARKIVDGRYPSLSMAVVRDGEIVYQRGFGLEDIKANRKATPQTQYHVASVTKAFTASLAVILHDRGVIDLDQPVVKYLPRNVSISTTPDLGATITVRQLASHTSGLPKGVPGQVQSVEGWYELEPQRLYDHLNKVQLESDPGTAEAYSNLGFGLLGHALERAAEKPFDRLMRELVCDPLQLERTAIQADDSLRVATGYGSGDWRIKKHSFKERLAASGGLVSSVEDLATFLAAQMEPGVFSSEMLKQLHTATTLEDGSAAGTALGWSVRSRDSVGRILKKNGGRSNCSAWIGFAPEYGVGVAVVTNCGGPDVDPIGYKLLEQSVSLSRKKLVTNDGFAKVAPFSGVRWENDQPIVRVRGKWSPLTSINDIPIDRIMEFAHKEYGEKASKRLTEDLVQLLSEMGHEPDWHVTLGLKAPDGKVEQLRILMTEDNRLRVRE